MNFRIQEVDGSEDHYSYELRVLHDLTFFDPGIVPNFEHVYWWLVWDANEPKALKPSPIAFAGFVHAASTPGAGYLKRAGVLKAFRGQGLQGRLITVRERKARVLGLTTMLTDTTENPASSNALIKAGYRIMEPSYRWAFEHSIYWKKDLTR